MKEFDYSNASQEGGNGDSSIVHSNSSIENIRAGSGVIYPLSDHAVDGREAETFTIADVLVRRGNEPLFTKPLACVGWVDAEDTTTSHYLTTHPHHFQELLDRGPAFCEELMQDGATQIITIALPDDEGFRQDQVGLLVTLDLNKEAGLITLSSKDGVRVSQDTSTYTPSLSWTKIIGPEEPYLEPPHEVLGNLLDGLYSSSPHYDKYPQLRHAFAALGFEGAAGDGKVTLPTPGEYARRLVELRETDTTSGIYYPTIQLIPGAYLDKQTFIESYASGRQPIATEGFWYFTHDAASDHSVALLYYGEPLMDFVSRYAQLGLTPDNQPAISSFDERREDYKGKIANNIDALTDYLGGFPIDQLYVEEPLNVGGDMIEGLREAGQLDSVRIVQWMLERGMINSADELDGAKLLNAFGANAEERFSSE